MTGNLSQKKYLTQKIWKFVLVFFLCLCLLLSSGRLASGDADTQMQASLLLARTGSLGTLTPPKILDNWIQSPTGQYYQVHDIGSVIVMLPSALLGSITSTLSTSELINSPPIITRLGISLTYACIGAIGCTFMYSVFAGIYPSRNAFFLSLAFLFTTMYGAYIKTAWDVLAGSSSVCALLYFSSQLLLGNRPQRNSLLMVLSFIVAVSFRYSLAPFLLIGMSGVFYFSRKYFIWTNYLKYLSLCFCGMFPSFIYNYIRMGNPLRPATTAPIYINGNNSLGGNVVEGLLGLMVSPNRGILLFCPILLLIIFLPIVWKKLAVLNRRLVISYSISACLYILLISSMKNWGSAGWGPRYLMPILPILFFVAASVLHYLWSKYIWSLVLLLSLSSLVSIPPMFVNWHLVSLNFPEANSMTAKAPQQIIGTWQGLMLGLQGQLLPASPEVLNDPIRRVVAKFPDIWWVKLAQQSSVGLIIGILISMTLLIVMMYCFLKVTNMKVPNMIVS